MILSTSFPTCHQPSKSDNPHKINYRAYGHSDLAYLIILQGLLAVKFQWQPAQAQQPQALQ